MKPFLTRSDVQDLHEDRLYLRRWSLWLPGRWSIKVHKIVLPDHDRCEHDHPWDFIRIILWGGYTEVRDGVEHVLKPWRPWAPWRIYPCRGPFKHRVKELASPTSWTLALCTPKKRNWGFYTQAGWISWQVFVDMARDLKVQWCDDGREV